MKNESVNLNHLLSQHRGIENQLKRAKVPPLAALLSEEEIAENKAKRDAEQKDLYDMFYAQQPRLKDKVENVMQLEQIVKEWLDAKYDMRPRMDKLLDIDFVEYRKTLGMVLKMEDSVGRQLGRLGLTLRPQSYVPVADRENFDPKAKASVQEQAKKRVDAALEM